MLYIGSDRGIYRWFSGTSWPIFHALQGRSIVGLASPGGGVLIALDAVGRVWESLTNGIEWRSIPLPEGAGRPTSLTLLSDSEILVATAKPLAVYRRLIGQPTETDAPSAIDRAKRFEEMMIGRAKAIATKVRGGSTATLERPVGRLFGWAPVAIPSAETSVIPPAVRLLTANAGTLYASVSGQGLWASASLGDSWSRVSGLPDDVFAVRFSGKTIAAGTSDGVWISADSGHSWTDSSVGLENVRQVRAIEIKPNDPKVLLAGAAPTGSGDGPVADRRGLRFALYESKDAGKTWKHVTRGFPEVLESDSIADIRVLPDDPSCAVIALNSGEMWSTKTDGLWWEPLARQIQSSRVLCATR